MYHSTEWAEYAKENGYDGVIIKDVYDIGGNSKNTELERSDIYIAFDGEQIKSLNPVTYDDNGDFIPLSERFNSEKKDIRYSLDINKDGENTDAHMNKSEWAVFYKKIGQLRRGYEFP